MNIVNWEIAITDPERGAGDKMYELPQVMTVQMTYAPIHDFLPRKFPNAYGGADKWDTLPAFVVDRVDNKNAWLTDIFNNANDYVELWWETDNTLVSLQAYASGTNYPSTASLITTMNYISPSALTNIYASSQGQGTATITHFANSTANKTYRYAIIG